MAFSDQDVLTWFNVNQGASDSAIASAMQQFGIGALQIARVTGVGLDEVNRRFNAATGQPAWTNRDVPMTPTPQPGMMSPPPPAPVAPAPYTPPVAAPVAPSYTPQPYVPPAPTAPPVAPPAAPVSDQDVLTWFNVNQGASDADIAKAMEQHNVNFDQIARVTGVTENEVANRYNDVKTGALTPTVTPTQPTPPVAPTQPTPPVAPTQPTPPVAPAAPQAPQVQDQGVTDEQIVQWLKANPTVSDRDIRRAMDENKVTVAQMARATQSDIKQIQQRYDNAYRYTTAAPVAPATPSKPPVGDYAGVKDTTGMVNLQTDGDYMNQLNQYYGAYFGGAQPDQGLLSSWYNTQYTPPITGYQKPTPVQQAIPQVPAIVGGSGGDFNFGGATANTGSGSSSAPGGQGISKVTQAASLNAMALAENPMVKAISPLLASALGWLGGLGADSQIDKEAEANKTLAALQTLSEFGFQTISDEDGNIRSITTPASVAAADEGMFGGSSGGGYRGGFGGVNNSAGSGFGSSVHGGSSFA